MTKQRRDTIDLDGARWFIESSLAVPFDPVREGVMDEGAFVDTASWRGHWCEYAVVGGRLCLNDVFFAGPPKRLLGGHTPRPLMVEHLSSVSLFRADVTIEFSGYFHYPPLGLPLACTTTLRCSNDATFSKDLELEFKEGMLVTSRRVRAGTVAPSPPPPFAPGR